MVLDVLLKQGIPVAYTRAHITARVISKRDRIGKALDIDDTLAALEIDHVTCTAEGAPVEHSTDIFLPRSLDLHVMRWLQDVPPVPAIGRAGAGVSETTASYRTERIASRPRRRGRWRRGGLRQGGSAPCAKRDQASTR